MIYFSKFLINAYIFWNGDLVERYPEEERLAEGGGGSWRNGREKESGRRGGEVDNCRRSMSALFCVRERKYLAGI